MNIRHTNFPPISPSGLDRRRFLSLTAMVGVGVSLAACTPGGSNQSTGAAGTGQPDVPRKGGTMTVGTPTPTGPVDPVTMVDIGAVDTVIVAAEYLTFPKADGTLEGRLATEWTSKNASTWTFKLRQGVSFHNGQTMTADDVVATFDRITDPKGGSAGLQSLGGILSPGGTKKIDDHTVVFNLDRGYADFPYLVSVFAYNTAIMPKDYKVGDFVKGGFGTGAYVLTSYKPNGKAEFKRNDNYWSPDAAYLDTLTVEFFADTNAQILAAQSGAIDLIPSVEPSALRTLKGTTNLVQQSAQSASFQTLQMRTDIKPFNDKRIRQALALTLDRPQMITALMDGKGTLANDHMFAPTFPSATEIMNKVPQRTRDTAKAKQLLAEAGYPDGLKVTLTTTRIFECVDHATIVKNMAKDAGFDITLEIMTPEQYFASGENSPWISVPLGITNWGSRGSASQILEATVMSGTPFNSARFSNAQLDELIKQFDEETDTVKRMTIGTSIAELLNDEVPNVISYFKDQVRVSAKRVGGMPAGPGDFPDYSKAFVTA